eukprot:4826666-Amphidinium_carterae.2
MFALLLAQNPFDIFSFWPHETNVTLEQSLYEGRRGTGPGPSRSSSGSSCAQWASMSGLQPVPRCLEAA